MFILSEHLEGLVVLEAVSGGWHAMPPNIFGSGKMTSAEMYTHVLKARARPWI